MRCSAFLVLCTIGISMGAVAGPSPTEIRWNLFKPNTAGCNAANAGALDLRIKVDHFGNEEGEHGSRLVSGFRQGDTLLIVRKSSAGKRALTYTLAELDRQQIATVLLLDSSHISVEDQARFVIPPEGTGWALFSNTSTVEGQGEYTITVRCLPRGLSSPIPIS
jgi:hypothetical protein